MDPLIFPLLNISCLTHFQKLTILERLDRGEVIIGDGGFVFQLEKRGYVKAGPWTPEAVIEHPDAVLQLHREFLRAGSDVMQALTFYASDDKLENRGNEAASKHGVIRFTDIIIIMPSVGCQCQPSSMQISCKSSI